MPDGGGIIIRNEDDAWQVLKRALAGEFDELEELDLQLEGWPGTAMRLSQGEASIYPGVMQGFLALQAGLHRSYGIVQNDDPSIVRLTNEEKRDLEIVVGVAPGSSDYKIDWQQACEKLLGKLVKKMKPAHIIIITVTIGVLYFGESAYREYLQYQLNIKTQEGQAQSQSALFEHLRFAGEIENERIGLIVEALDRISSLSGVAQQSDEAKKEVLKALSQYGESQIGSLDLDPGVVANVLKSARSRSEQHELLGEFEILQVDTTAPDGFRVKLRQSESGVEFWARLVDALMSEPQRRAIQDAEWGEHPFEGRVEVTFRGDKIVDAIIREVTLLEGGEEPVLN